MSSPTTTEWAVEQTHATGCAACDEAADYAIGLATASGSRGASYTTAGNCTARATRRTTVTVIKKKDRKGTPNEFGGHDLTGPGGCVRSSADDEGEAGWTIYRFDPMMRLLWSVSFSADAPFELFDAAWQHAAEEVEA